jgi:hypothetical protein
MLRRSQGCEHFGEADKTSEFDPSGLRLKMCGRLIGSTKKTMRRDVLLVIW